MKVWKSLQELYRSGVTILSATFNQLELKMICGRKHVLKFDSTVIETYSICTKSSKLKEKKKLISECEYFQKPQRGICTQCKSDLGH